VAIVATGMAMNGAVRRARICMGGKLLLCAMLRQLGVEALGGGLHRVHHGVVVADQLLALVLRRFITPGSGLFLFLDTNKLGITLARNIPEGPAAPALSPSQARPDHGRRQLHRL